jgi:hypothetical protein
MFWLIIPIKKNIDKQRVLIKIQLRKPVWNTKETEYRTSGEIKKFTSVSTAKKYLDVIEVPEYFRPKELRKELEI